MSKRITRDPRILNVMMMDLIEFTTFDGRELIAHVDSIQCFFERVKGHESKGSTLLVGGLEIWVRQSVSEILEELLDHGRLDEELGDDVTEITKEQAIDAIYLEECDGDDEEVDNV